MAARNKLVIRNPNAIRDMQRRIGAHAVAVGVHGDAGAHKDEQGHATTTTVAEVYWWNEFGTSRIPERPTLRPTFAKEKVKYIQILGKITARVMNEENYNLRQAMGRLGEVAQQDLQAAIVALKSPPNAPSTIEKKKSDNPLVDTGQLVSSIRWAYVKPEE